MKAALIRLVALGAYLHLIFIGCEARATEGHPETEVTRTPKPLTNVEIAAAIVTAKSYGEEAMPALIRRVRANLSYLLRNDRVAKTGNRMTARWALAAV